MQPTGYGGPPPMMQQAGSFEFSEYENATIARVAKFARAWGIISIAGGLLLGLLSVAVGGMASLGGTVNHIPAGALAASLGPLALVYLACGWFYIASGGSLSSVVTTQGNDVALLMNAVNALKKAFMIEAIASVVAVVVGFGLGMMAHVGK